MPTNKPWLAHAATSPQVPATSSSAAVAGPEARLFEEDVAFLARHGAVTVLEAPSGGRIAVSPKYQARVMTSAVEAHGKSLGFVNRSFIEAGQTGTAFDNYGGEDRLWLGPEGGQYALYFAQGKPFTFEHWQTPQAFQAGEWQCTAGSARSVTFARGFALTNYAGTDFQVGVERKISLLDADHIQDALGLELPSTAKWVAFSSENTLTNAGNAAWTEAGGLPSIWILGMFSPAPDTRIVLPFEAEGSGEVVNARYFGEVPADRLSVKREQGFAVFKADGQARGKVGLSATRAKAVLGSYSAASALLTMVRFSKPAGATRYVNNLWELSTEPYGGDVSNAYNDGPVEPGKPSLGGFYELESSSPAAQLTPGACLLHSHETYHFSGPKEALEAVAVKALGVSLNDLETC